MLRFHVFISEHYYPQGFEDYVGSYRTYEMALEKVNNRHSPRNSFGQVVWTDDDGALTTNIPEEVK